jgi:perosamine synthetase
VLDVLRGSALALGPRAEELERRLAARAGVRHAVAVSSGTAALHMAVRACGLKPGDEVITTPFSFVASSNVLLMEGVKPVFADIDPVTWNLDPRKARERLAPKTRAVLAVDLFGLPCDYDALLGICRERGLFLIEDACEAIGGSYQGKPCGSFGRCAAFAFYPNKQMTTGEGGALLTDEAALAEDARSLRNQGRGADSQVEHVRLGYNYRMDELSSALGCSQEARLDEMLVLRARVARWYHDRLREVPGLGLLDEPRRCTRSWFVYVVRLPEGASRERVIERLKQKGIESRGYFQPIHLFPFYRELLGHRPGDFPNTEAVAASTLALPFFNALTEPEVDRVCRALSEALREPIEN